MKTFITNSEKETRNLAKKIAQEFKLNIIALTGNLGSGKTTFVQGFAKGLGIKEKIISPTFVLIRQHQIPNFKKMLYHIDLYRLEGEIDIKQLGIADLLNEDSLILIEWAEKIKDQLPKNTTWINFESKDGSKHQITVSAS